MSRSPLFDELLRVADPDWSRMLAEFERPNGAALHLAVFVEPYLGYILDGSKTVESRFSTRAIPPHGRVRPGDEILLKPSSRPVTGWCRAGDVWDYEVDERRLADLRTDFDTEIRAQHGFWDRCRNARFATLFRVTDVHPTAPLPVPKRDRRSWVVLADGRHEEATLWGG